MYLDKKNTILRMALGVGLVGIVTIGTYGQSVTQAVPGPVCVGQTTQFVYSGGCPSQNINWFLEGSNTDATVVPTGTNMVNITWNSAGPTTVVAYCSSNPSLTGATSGLTINASGGTPSVTISGPSSICLGAPATYTASPTNGGSSPTYAWKVNNVIRQNGSSNTFSPTDLQLGDAVSVTMVSNKPCISSPSANSSAITISSVTQPTQVSVDINDPGPMCPSGQTGLTFTAVPTNGGANPQYTWYRNSSEVIDNEIQGSTNEYRPHYPLQNGETIQVKMTSSLSGCLSDNPAWSNLVEITIEQPDPPIVSINYSPSIPCEGGPITFTASTNDARYQITGYNWRINTSATMSTSPQFTTDELRTDDVVHLTATVTGGCTSGSASVEASTSGILNLQPGPPAIISPWPSAKRKSTESLQINVSPGYSYQWTKNGELISGATGSSYEAVAEGVYAAIITATNGCSITSNSVTFIRNKVPIVSAGPPQILHIPPTTKTLHGYAYDEDGTELTIEWTKVSGPSVTLINANTLDLTLEDLEVGTYVFKLTATDDFSESAFATVEVIVLPLENNYNWIKETTVLQEGSGTVSDVFDLEITESEKNVDYTYFDGLGRPMQKVSVEASPAGFDIVTPIVYDQYGRETIKFLPYVPQENDGWFKVDATGEGQFPNGYPQSPHSEFYQMGGDVATDNHPFAVTVFEPSPLNRVLEQGAPGTAWQPGTNDSYASNDRTVKFAYEVNTSADQVILWTYTPPSTDYPLGLVSAGSTSVPNYYAAGQLYKTKTKDEQHHEVVEFKDKQDRVILKRVQAPNGEWAQTYYVYDDFGNLVVVLPPEAVKQMDDLFIGSN
jgi:hypothetical protein